MALTYDEMVAKSKNASATKTTSIGAWDAMRDPNANKADVIAQLSTSKANPKIGKTLGALDLKQSTTNTAPSFANKKSVLSLLQQTPKAEPIKGNLMASVQNRLATAPQTSIPQTTTADKIASLGKFDNSPKAAFGTLNNVVTKQTTLKQPVQNKQTNTDIEKGAYMLGNVISDNKANTPLTGLRYDLARGAAGAVGAAEGVTDFLVGGLNNIGSTITSGFGFAPNAVSKWFDEGAKAVYDNDVAGAMRKGIEDKVDDNKNWSSNLTGELWDMAGNIMAAGGAGKAASGVAKISAPVLSKGIFGISAGGNSAQQAYNEGATAMQAGGYGNAIAATTIAVESAFGGVPIFGKGILDDIIKGLDKSPKALQALVGMVGEGGEEAIQTFITPYLQRIYYNPEAKNATIEQMLTDAALGAGLSGIMQGASLVGSVGTNTNAPTENVEVNKIAPNVNPLTPTLAKATQNVPQQVTQPITNNIAPNLVKLPALEQNAAETKQTAPEANKTENVGEIKSFVSPTKEDVQAESDGYNIKAYHGTGRSEIKFVPDYRGAIWLTNSKHQGEKYATRGAHDGTGTNLDVYASIKKPYTLSVTENENWDIDDAVKKASAAGADGLILNFVPSTYLSNDIKLFSEDFPSTPARSVLTQRGIDWLAKDGETISEFANRLGNEPLYSYYAVFSPQQIKKSSDYSVKSQPINNQSSTNMFPENSLGARITTPKQALPQGTGASSPQFAYQEKVNQQNSTNSAFTNTERQIEGLRTEDSTHQVITDLNATAKARERLDFDYEGEKSDLPNKQDWDKTDTTAAHLILRNLTESAQATGDYSEVIKWNKTLEAHKSAQGQALQANKQFANTPEKIIAEAADVLEKVAKLNPRQKAGIMDSVVLQAKAYNNIQIGDTSSIIELIKRNNEIRKTTGMFSKETSRSMSEFLDYSAENFSDADAFLREVATTQIRNIAGDYQQVSPLEAIKSYRIMGMLSKVSTLLRNFTSNTIIDPIDSIAGNMVVPIDMLLSKYTGTRAVPVDKSWFSDAKRKGSIDGFVKSAIQVGLDADVSDSQSKYETRSGRVFKMTGNTVERFLSTWSKWENYGLQSTDEFAKGGISAESKRGIDKLKSKGLVAKDALSDRPMEIAKQRTLQNDGMIATAMLKGREAANVIGVKDKQGGLFGLGDLALPFARVPANATAMTANYTPAGLVKAAFNLTKTIKQAHDGKLTADQQAKAVTDLGRALSGTAGVAMFTGLAIMGIIKVAGSDDKDKEALATSEGQRGTQFNISALARWLSGDNTKWQSDDTLISLGFMEQLNGQMVMGSMIAEAYKDDGTISFGDVANANATAIFQSVLELPAMSQLNELVNGYKYSESDKIGGKLADAAIGYGASQASSFVVPNIIGGVATGLDDTVRNTYSSKNPFMQAKDSILSKIPFARNTLPAKLDNFGNERNYTGNTALNILNANILPGQVGKYDTNAINQELFKQNTNYPARSAPSSFKTATDEVDLTPTEKDAYQKTYGQYVYKELDKLFKSSEFAKMTEDEQTEAKSGIYSDANSLARQTIVEARGNVYVPNATTAKKFGYYTDAGVTEKKASEINDALTSLKPEAGEKSVSIYQKIQTINKQGLTPKQQAGIVATLYTSHDDDGNITDESLLPYISNSARLLSLYTTSKGENTKMINMTIPKSFVSKDVEYELTDAEKKLYKDEYTKYFNAHITSVSTEANVEYFGKEAADRAKKAVIKDRKK